MKLSNENIGKVVENAENFFAKAGVSQKDKIKISLALEESLLRFQDHFGADSNFSITSRKWFSTSKMTIRLKGAPFNPLDVSEEEEDVLPSQMLEGFLNYETAKVFYRYENGYNEINFSSMKERKPIKIPGGSLTIVVLLAIVCAFVTKMLSPDTQHFLMDTLAKPIESTFMKLIVAVTGPFVFTSIVAGICVMSDVSTLQKVGLKILRRFAALMAITGIVTAVVSQMFFQILTLGGEVDFSPSVVIQMFLEIIPPNLFTPFSQGNVMQIVFVALMTGVCILIVENFVPETRKIVDEFNRIAMQMMSLVKKIVPVTIFFNIYQILLTETPSDIITTWKVIAVNLIALLIMAAIMLANLAIRYHVNISEFLKKISDVLIISLSTRSSSAALPRNMEIAKNDLKINPKLCDFWIPLSQSLYAPTKVAPLVICVFFAARYYDVTISFENIFLIIFLAMQISISVPMVAGLALILTHFHLPTDVVGMVLVAGIFTGNIGTSVSMLVRNCELVNVSHEIKMD